MGTQGEALSQAAVPGRETGGPSPALTALRPDRGLPASGTVGRHVCVARSPGHAVQSRRPCRGRRCVACPCRVLPHHRAGPRPPVTSPLFACLPAGPDPSEGRESTSWEATVPAGDQVPGTGKAHGYLQKAQLSDELKGHRKAPRRTAGPGRPVHPAGPLLIRPCWTTSSLRARDAALCPSPPWAPGRRSCSRVCEA